MCGRVTYGQEVRLQGKRLVRMLLRIHSWRLQLSLQRDHFQALLCIHK